MEKFIVWYDYEGEDDYMVIEAADEDEARRKFYGYSSCTIVEIRQLEENEYWLAYC